jgi:hypothetical protein
MKMENIKAFYIDTFPLDGAIKKEDLIFYDFPLLTRYFYQDKNYLYYHVDDEKNLDTYLVFEIEEYNLFKLVSGITTLRETIFNVDKFVYIIDKNDKGKVVKTAYLHSSTIIDDYLPEEDSIIEINYTKDSYFNKLVEKYKADYYTERLREKAFYLKIAPEQLNKKYGDTLGLEEMVDEILPKITDSYKKYSRSDFDNRFKSKITDVKQLNSTYKKVYELIDYRIVDLKYGSFEIGIASDTLMTTQIDNKELKDWANTVGDNFKEDVLEIDLNDPEELKRIALKFDEDQRNKIYSPIINLANDRNIVFSIKDHKFSKYKNIKKPKLETIKKLIPEKPIVPELISKELDLIQFTGVVEKGKKISANNYGLFNSLNEAHQLLTNETFKKYNINIELKENIPLILIKKDAGNIEISAIYKGEPFIVSLDNANFESAIEKLVKRIHEYYLNLN